MIAPVKTAADHGRAAARRDGLECVAALARRTLAEATALRAIGKLGKEDVRMLDPINDILADIEQTRRGLLHEMGKHQPELREDR